MFAFSIVSIVLASIFCLWMFAWVVGAMIAADFDAARFSLMTFCVGAVWLLTAVFLYLQCA